MGKGARWVSYLLFCSVLIAISARYPSLLSDKGNEFLKDFLDFQILSVLGVLTAVGNAASLTIFLRLREIEDNSPARFNRASKSLKKSALSLLAVFLVAFGAVVIKPLLPEVERYQALINSVGIACVVFALSVIKDLTMTVFAIPNRERIMEIYESNKSERP